MTSALILSIALLVAGLYFFTRNVLLLLDDRALDAYMRNNPKAALLVSRYGLHEATRKTRALMPVGAAMALAMAGFACWNLWRLLAA